MGLAKRRHESSRVLARRRKQWKAISWPFQQADGSLLPVPAHHFLKTTARPCSCYICKRPRYKREPKDRTTSDF